MALHIPAHEQGVIYVFAVNRAPTQLRQALKTTGKDALVAELLDHTLPATGTELIATADLTGVGLSGYLAEGYAVPDAQLKGMRAKLDALDGYVLLVFSSAFEGRETTLNVTPDVTYIGRFGEYQPDTTPLPLEADAAAPYTGTPPDAAPVATPRARYGSAVVALLLVLAAGILWWALF